MSPPEDEKGLKMVLTPVRRSKRNQKGGQQVPDQVEIGGTVEVADFVSKIGETHPS